MPWRAFTRLWRTLERSHTLRTHTCPQNLSPMSKTGSNPQHNSQLLTVLQSPLNYPTQCVTKTNQPPLNNWISVCPPTTNSSKSVISASAPTGARVAAHAVLAECKLDRPLPRSSLPPPRSPQVVPHLAWVVLAVGGLSTTPPHPR